MEIHYTQRANSPNELRALSLSMSKQIIEITTKAGSGHPSSSLSAIDILTCLYFKPIMSFNPTLPNERDRDRFILSKGHAAPALYTVLANAGFFDVSLLQSLRQLDSPLEGHPNRRLLSGVEASTGSLGQGLSIGVGHALAGMIDNRDFHVYVMIGDGELQEGQIWEAAMLASSHELSNLTAIIDYNQFQQTGAVNNVMPSLYPLPEKWRAFGWHTEEVDGHNIDEILKVFEKIMHINDKPQVIIAHTSKGKNLSSFTKDEESHKHGKPLKPEEVDLAIDELNKYYQ